MFQIVFPNTEDVQQLNADRTRSEIFVKRQGDFTLSPRSHLQEEKLYKGKITFPEGFESLLIHDNLHFLGEDNPLIFLQTISLTFQCSFYLQLFPFDTQTCHILLQVPKHMQKFTDLLPGLIEYSGSKTLPQYQVRSPTHTKLNNARL